MNKEVIYQTTTGRDERAVCAAVLKMESFDFH